MGNLNKTIGLTRGGVYKGWTGGEGVACFNLQELNDLPRKTAYQCNAVKASFHV